MAMIVGFLGGISSRFLFPESPLAASGPNTSGVVSMKKAGLQVEQGHFNQQFERMQDKIRQLENRLNEIAGKKVPVPEPAEHHVLITHEKSGRQRSSVVPQTELLVSAGVSREAADDILRRLGQQEFRSLELRNLIQRSAPADRQRYAAELRELTRSSVTLRTELGDDAYDRYLFVSGKNNRVKVASVMAGSPAEINGIREGDVILYHGNRKILTASDLSKATLEGDIGSYTNVEILRDGTGMSLLLPSGTLGVQLEPERLDPDG